MLPWFKFQFFNPVSLSLFGTLSLAENLQQSPSLLFFSLSSIIAIVTKCMLASFSALACHILLAFHSAMSSLDRRLFQIGLVCSLVPVRSCDFTLWPRTPADALRSSIHGARSFRCFSSMFSKTIFPQTSYYEHQSSTISIMAIRVLSSRATLLSPISLCSQECRDLPLVMANPVQIGLLAACEVKVVYICPILSRQCWCTRSDLNSRV